MTIFADGFATSKGRWQVAVGVESDGDAFASTALWADESGYVTVASDGSPCLNRYRVSFSGLASFLLCFETRQIRVLCGGNASPDFTIQHLLADQIAPRIIAHEGSLVVHAGAVELDGHGIVLLGASGLGKSTLSASFLQQGDRLLGDDAIIISNDNGIVQGQAVYRSLRLLPDSVASIFPVRPALSDVAHYTQKQHVTIPLMPDQEERPARLSAFFVLAPDDGDGVISLRRMSCGETCMALLENSFWLDPTDLDGARLKMEQAGAAASAVPAFVLRYPRDYAQIAHVQAAIRGQLALLNGNIARPDLDGMAADDQDSEAGSAR